MWLGIMLDTSSMEAPSTFMVCHQLADLQRQKDKQLETVSNKLESGMHHAVVHGADRMLHLLRLVQQ